MHEKCLVSLVMKGKQIRTRYNFSPVKLAKIKKKDSVQFWQWFD